MAQATRKQKLLITLIGRALNPLNFAADPTGRAPATKFKFARVLALGEAGVLEVTGSGPGMCDHEVRLPMIVS
ncbi:hypothetical protein ACFZ8E_02615 [Methylobacterium sp. HMF5984]|uniref:hypothetical protein n=1 Tax=Methylobacterium sp. HMF5984 TaxID=3367370 RepID=UPI0038535974